MESESLEKVWNVGQLILLKENVDFSTIYVGHISHVYENRLVIIVVSETKPFLPRIVKIKNRVWEVVVKDYEIKDRSIVIKPFSVKNSFMELYDAKTDSSV